VKRSISIVVLSLGLGALGLYLVAGPRVFSAETYRLPSPDGNLLLLCFLAFTAQWLVPPIRLTVLSKQQRHALHYPTALLIHLIAFLSAAITPGGSGSAPAIVAGFKQVGMPWGRSIGMAIQITVLDLIFFAWAVPLSLLYLMLSGVSYLSVNIVVYAALSAALAVAGSVMLGRYPRLAVRFMLFLSRRPVLGRFKRRLQMTARDYYRSTRVFMNLGWLPWFYLQSLGAVGWLSTFVLFWGLLNLYHQVDFLAVMAMLNIATLLSFAIPTPGASGFMEVAVGYGTSTQISSTDLAAPLLLWRLGSFYLIYALGPLAGWLFFRRGVKRKPRTGLRPEKSD
nr:flippase-like domain-containing protein [Deinococcota bacterium]